MDQAQAQAQAQTSLCKIIVPSESSEYLHKLSKLNKETLRILAELSNKPGIDQKVKKNEVLIKSFL